MILQPVQKRDPRDALADFLSEEVDTFAKAWAKQYAAQTDALPVDVLARAIELNQGELFFFTREVEKDWKAWLEENYHVPILAAAFAGAATLAADEEVQRVVEMRVRFFLAEHEAALATWLAAQASASLAAVVAAARAARGIEETGVSSLTIIRAVNLGPKMAGAVTRRYFTERDAGVKAAVARKNLKLRAVKSLNQRGTLTGAHELASLWSRGAFEAARELVRTGKLEAGLVAKWLTSGVRVCPICAPLHGQVVNLGETFGTGTSSPFRGLLPPVHIHCNCAVHYLVPGVEIEPIPAPSVAA